MNLKVHGLLCGAIVAGMLLAAGTAHAQWVNLARRAVGRIEQLSQSQGEDGVSYESAAVMLEVPLARVWSAVLHGLRTSPQGITITREDPAAHIVQFTNGKQIAGIKLSPLGDNLTHLLVSTAQQGNGADASAQVTNRVLLICREMSVECATAP